MSTLVRSPLAQACLNAILAGATVVFFARMITGG
jgi:hypothetical protein